ncbi:MAG: ABC transporter ATP-binding protein [Microbacteriaceae bacterium]|nr:ABC transporter ATP-binding protein [Microbacteriaceae bacterium]
MPVLQAIDVSRIFKTPAGPVQALAPVSLEVSPGQLMVVKGRSGSGKSTLLSLLGGIDKPTTGQVLIDGEDTQTANESRKIQERREKLGFIFQGFGLLSMLTAAENVELPLRLNERNGKKRDRRVEELLELVGLGAHARQRPYELSGGQQQRVGIARALANNPKILIADEPTGQLDSVTGASIMKLFHDLTRSQNLAAVISTHDPSLVEMADVVVELHSKPLEQSVA